MCNELAKQTWEKMEMVIRFNTAAIDAFIYIVKWIVFLGETSHFEQLYRWFDLNVANNRNDNVQAFAFIVYFANGFALV